jgi:hypothetical protein
MARRRPFRPHFTYLFRLVLARSRGPSESQASHFLAHLALLVPPEALCSPATSPKLSKRCPYGARLAPATGGAPATFSAPAARPPQQSSRRVPGGDCNPRPARSPYCQIASKAPALQRRYICRAGLKRVVFYEASAAISVKTKIKGTRYSIDQEMWH